MKCTFQTHACEYLPFTKMSLSPNERRDDLINIVRTSNFVFNSCELRSSFFQNLFALRKPTEQEHKRLQKPRLREESTQMKVMSKKALLDMRQSKVRQAQNIQVAKNPTNSFKCKCYVCWRQQEKEAKHIVSSKLVYKFTSSKFVNVMVEKIKKIFRRWSL